MQKPYRDFIVVTSQRTGSTWLMDLLNHVPGIQGHQELLLPQKRMRPPMAGRNDYARFIETERRGWSRIRPIGLFRYLDTLYRRSDSIGFKAMYSQIRALPELLLYVIVRRVRIVHLIRLNDLNVIVSEYVAEATGVSHTTRNEAPPQIRLQAKVLSAQLRRLRVKRSIIRALMKIIPVPVLEISYESLVSEQAQAPVCSFLGISELPQDFPTKLVKRQQRQLRDVIVNYDEVVKVVEKHPRQAWMLDQA